MIAALQRPHSYNYFSLILAFVTHQGVIPIFSTRLVQLHIVEMVQLKGIHLLYVTACFHIIITSILLSSCSYTAALLRYTLCKPEACIHVLMVICFLSTIHNISFKVLKCVIKVMNCWDFDVLK